MEIDCVYVQDCLETMANMEPETVDLIVTSPPYAKQRDYEGMEAEKYPERFMVFAKEIYKVLAPSGSFVLNIKEHVTKGNRDPYVFKTVLALSTLFNWKDTYIWNKTNPFPTGSKKRLKDGFEYCFWFTKTQDYKFFPENVLIPSTSKCLESEKRRKNNGRHDSNNSSGMKMSKRCAANDMVRPSNVITFPIDCTNHEHPATFPLALPSFFIRLMSEPGDLVYDPFCGSETTLIAAKELNRHYVGSEIEGKWLAPEIACKKRDTYSELSIFRLRGVCNTGYMSEGDSKLSQVEEPT